MLRGWAGGKKINGRTRHLSVDTLGLVLRAFVTEANDTDRDVARWLIALLPARFPPLKKRWAAGMYRGAEFIADRHRQSGIEVASVDRDPTVKGFKRLATRWLVERTLAWRSDDAFLVKTRDAMLYPARVHLMLRRRAPVR